MATPFFDSIAGLLYAAIDAAVKAALLLALVAIIAILSRRASASFRHMTWALGLGCTLCLPLLSQNLPHWRVPVATLPTHSRPAAEEAPPLADAAQPKPHLNAPVEPRAKSSVPSVATLPRDVPEPPTAVQPSARVPELTVNFSTASAPQVPWITLPLLVWLSGSVIMLAQLAQVLLKVRRIATTSASLIFGPVADAAVKAMSVGRPVALRQASSPGQVTVPFTYGLLHPVIVLPAEATQWPDERLRAALLHEMAHVRRYDWSFLVIGHIARALYWFNPLVWVATRRLRAESEAAADDLVLSFGMPAPEYARHLLDVALAARHSRRISQGAVAMAQSPKVEERLRAVLAQGLSRHPVTRRAAAGFVTVTVLATLPLAALRLVAQAQGVPVAAADRLQLQGDFTLRYAVAVTDMETTQAQVRQYQQLRAQYAALLRKDPYFQPVPAEYYAPFSYFQRRRPRTRHLILTVSARHGQLLWRKEEDGHTSALLYDARTGTQRFSDGQAGGFYPGLKFDEMNDCPLPAVGLPHVPLFKAATLVSSSGASQEWQALSPVEDADDGSGAVYLRSTAHMVNDGGTWKTLDVDGTSQRWQFLRHQRFQGLWVASHMWLTKYTVDQIPENTLPSRFTTLKDFDNWFNARRRPTESCEYRLLSASTTPLNASAVGMRAVSTAPHSTPAIQDQQLDDLYVQEALHLRYHLQDWAEAHKALLQQMAQAKPNGRITVGRVYESLSALPVPLWQGDPRPNHVWDGDPRIGHDGQKPLFEVEHLTSQDNPASRDFEIARSLNPGRVHIVLWASGRVTRNTAQGTKGPETQQEVVPAFFGADGTSNMATATTRADSGVPSGSPQGTKIAAALVRDQQAVQTAHQNAQQTTDQPGHQQDGAIVSGNLNPNTIQDTANLTHTRRKMMKNNSFGPKTALALPLAATLSGSFPHPGLAQTATDATEQRASVSSVRGINHAASGNVTNGRVEGDSVINRGGRGITTPKTLTAPDPPNVTTDLTDPNIAAAQGQLRRVTTGYQAGINSRSDVNEAATALAEARIRAATARNEFAGLAPDLEAVVRHRQELLDETKMRFRAGASDMGAVNRAEEAVAEAHVRADLYAVLKARQSTISEVTALYRSGATTAQEVDKAAAALQKAQHAFIGNGE